MDKELRDLFQDNVMGEYEHAGLGIVLGLALGPLAGLLIGSLAAGLALGIALGLLTEVMFEMQDSRRHKGPRPLEH